MGLPLGLLATGLIGFHRLGEHYNSGQIDFLLFSCYWYLVRSVGWVDDRWVDERRVERNGIPDPGALGTGPGECGDKGVWPRDVCRSRELSKHLLLVCPKSLEKHVKAKTTGKKWKVGKGCKFKGGLCSHRNTSYLPERPF